MKDLAQRVGLTFRKNTALACQTELERHTGPVRGEYTSELEKFERRKKSSFIFRVTGPREAMLTSWDSMARLYLKAKLGSAGRHNDTEGEPAHLLNEGTVLDSQALLAWSDPIVSLLAAVNGKSPAVSLKI